MSNSPEKVVVTGLSKSLPVVEQIKDCGDGSCGCGCGDFVEARETIHITRREQE